MGSMMCPLSSFPISSGNGSLGVCSALAHDYAQLQTLGRMGDKEVRMLDPTVPGNRLLQNSKGEIELVPSSMFYGLGRQLVRPAFNRMCPVVDFVKQMFSHECTMDQAPPVEAHLKPQYLSLIKSGQKTIEGRTAEGKYLLLQEGSRIHFSSQQEQVTCLVIRVTKYTSFKEMLLSEGVDKCLPGSSLAGGVKIFNSFPGYKERAQKNGVLAIEVRVET